MEFKALQCFVAAAEQLNFTRAAELLYLSQPTLSIHIRELEEELGAALFHRDHKQVFLTKQGAALLPAARQILEEIDGLPTLIHNAEAIPMPASMQIGIDLTEDRTDIPTLQNILRLLSERVPAMRLNVSRVDHESCIQRLLDGSIDVAIIVLESDKELPADLLTLSIWRDQTVLVAAHAGGMTVEEILADREFLLFQESAKPGRLPLEQKYVEYVRQIAPNVRIRPMKDTTSMILDLQCGNSVSVLPSAYVNRLDKELFTVFPTPLPDLVLTLAWNKYNMNPAIEMMYHLAQREVGQRKHRITV